MVSTADKPAEADLLLEKNTLPWMISHADKFKRTGRPNYVEIRNTECSICSLTRHYFFIVFIHFIPFVVA